MSFATEHFQRFARYSAWANRRLLGACAKLPTADYLRERSAFFKGLHGTLNHILVADRIWLGRFRGVDHGIVALDEMLCPDLEGLRQARENEDRNLIEFVDGLRDADYERIVHFRTMAGEALSGATGALLAHVFNHQTHHRGQAHDQLSQTTVAPPPLDLLFYLRDIG